MRKPVKGITILRILIFLIAMTCLVSSAAYGSVLAAEKEPYINKSSIAMYVGEKDKLEVTGDIGAFTYDSLDTNVVVVDQEGYVTAVGVGDTHILVEGELKSFVVYIVVKKSELSESSTTVYIDGESKKLEIYGNNGQTVTWKSKNEGVAIVLKDGTVKGVSVGITTIIASMGGEEYFCTVYVKKPYLSEKEIHIKTGNTYELRLIGSSGKVTYKVVDETVAKVNSAGIITGIREGTTKVILSYKNTSYPLVVKVAEARLSSNKAQLWTNKEAVLTIQLKDRQRGESITVTDSKDIVDVRIGNWSGDTVKIILTPKKDGTSKLKITRKNSTESIEIIVHAAVRRLLTAEEIYKAYASATVSILSYDAVGNKKVGSGFFIDSGMLVTNYHVIEYANKLEVLDYKGKAYEVKGIYDYNTINNLAILEVEPSNEAVFYINKEAVQTGEIIYTIGSPLEYIGTISDGMISYAARELDGIQYIQVTAPISKSSGGGPLINEYGEVIGINTLTVPAAQNINFSVKIGYLNQLNKNNKRNIEEFYEENKDKVMDMTIEIVIG